MRTQLPRVLPLIDFTEEGAGQAFFESLASFGFATLINHPLDMRRVERIYTSWRDYFAEGVGSEFEMDPMRQDGYFALEQAESAKGQVLRDHKQYFQFYGWGRCPEHLKQDLSDHFDDCVGFASTLLGGWPITYPLKLQGTFDSSGRYDPRARSRCCASCITRQFLRVQRFQSRSA